SVGLDARPFDPADYAEPDAARPHAGAHHDADAPDLRWHDVLLPGRPGAVLGGEQHPVDRSAAFRDAPDRQGGRRSQALISPASSRKTPATGPPLRAFPFLCTALWYSLMVFITSLM